LVVRGLVPGAAVVLLRVAVLARLVVGLVPRVTGSALLVVGLVLRATGSAILVVGLVVVADSVATMGDAAARSASGPSAAATIGAVLRAAATADVLTAAGTGAVPGTTVGTADARTVTAVGTADVRTVAAGMADALAASADVPTTAGTAGAPVTAGTGDVPTAVAGTAAGRVKNSEVGIAGDRPAEPDVVVIRATRVAVVLIAVGRATADIAVARVMTRVAGTAGNPAMTRAVDTVVGRKVVLRVGDTAATRTVVRRTAAGTPGDRATNPIAEGIAEAATAPSEAAIGGDPVMILSAAGSGGGATLNATAPRGATVVRETKDDGRAASMAARAAETTALYGSMAVGT
jgi:hypothetical protein